MQKSSSTQNLYPSNIKNDFFKLLSENISDVIGITDINGIIKYRSSKNKEFFGFDSDEVIGKSAFEFIHPTDLIRIKEDFNRLINLEDNASIHSQYRYLNKDGTFKIIEITGKNMLNHPLIEGILITLHDISEKVELIHMLRTNNERYNALIESTGTMIWSVDINDFKLVTYNSFMSDYFKRVLKIDLKAGLTPHEMVPEKAAIYWIDLYKRVIKDGPIQTNYQMISDDRLLNVALNPMYINNQLIGISVFTYDVTDLRKMSIKFEEENTIYQTLIQNMHDYVFEIDADTYEYIYFNQYQAEFIKNTYGIELTQGLSSRIFMSEESLKFWEDAYSKTKQNGIHEFQIRTFSGNSFINFKRHYLANDLNKSSILIFGEDITKEVTFQQNLEKTNNELEISNKKLQAQFQNSINAISKLGELRDAYTAGHQVKVTDLACRIAQELNLDENSINNLRLGSMIHDIGKISIPSEILNKPGKIEPLEMMILRTHAEMGYKIIKEIDFPPEVSLMVIQHHERIDGSGYPFGLSGDKILLESKILAIADVIEAMSSHRPYRPALGIHAAMEEIKQYSGIKYETEIVNICLDLFNNKGYMFPEIKYNSD